VVDFQPVAYAKLRIFEGTKKQNVLKQGSVIRLKNSGIILVAGICYAMFDVWVLDFVVVWAS